MREAAVDDAMSLLKMNAKFRPGTVFENVSDDWQTYIEYVAISHPFPHPDLPIYQIWAVPIRFRDAPEPEIVDIATDTYPTLWGKIVEGMVLNLLGFAVMGFLVFCAYLLRRLFQ